MAFKPCQYLGIFPACSSSSHDSLSYGHFLLPLPRMSPLLGPPKPPLVPGCPPLLSSGYVLADILSCFVFSVICHLEYSLLFLRPSLLCTAEGFLVRIPPLPLTSFMSISIIWKMSNVDEEKHIVVAKDRLGMGPMLVR